MDLRDSPLFLLGLFLLVVALSVPARASLPIDAYPDAIEMYRSNEETNDYRLTLGALKKINNIWRAEQEERLAGQLSRTTWELPLGHSAEEGFAHYLQQLQALPFEELFGCRARSCGSSNSWANVRFQVKQLYGLDKYQRYGAYRVVFQDAAYYVSLYSIRRGNKRAYVHMEVLLSPETKAQKSQADSESMLVRLQAQGFLSLVLSEDGQALMETDTVVALLNSFQQGEGAFALVGHDYGSGTQAQRQTRSLAYAQAVKAQLVAGGIAADKLQVHGLGSLAPAGRGDKTFRVDLVPLSETE